MQVLLKQVRIIDPSSSHHGQVKDILIKNGIIEAIRNSISSKAKTIDVGGACISPGWLDVGTFVGDPGFEHIETITSVSSAAAKGGYTGLAVLPNTYPAIQSKSEVEYLIRRGEHLSTDIYPLGSLTTGCKGEELAELIDMKHAGAIGFTDGKNSVQNPGMLLRGLEYVKSFDGILINHPSTRGLVTDGLIDEGPISVSLGLSGIPELAEVMMVKRDLDLLKYSESRLHLLNISCRESVELIVRAREDGYAVTCSIPVQNLLETVESTSSFDPNYKVLPPLRSEENRKFLLKAVKDGQIDFITSNHRPVNIEGKKLEFAYADFGISSLETSFNILLKAWGKPKKLDHLVNVLAIAPRKALSLEIPTIQRNQPANLTIFHPEETSAHSTSEFKSRSKNNPYLDRELPGKVIGVINKGMTIINS